MFRVACIISLTVTNLAISRFCSAGDLLFTRATRSYDHNGAVGEAYRREFEARMFQHGTWTQRLYCETADFQANETIEIFAKADGSRWLSFRRAEPALSPLIKRHPLPNQRAELTAELDRIKIASCEVLLPPTLATELEGLWNAMLPGVDVPPLPHRFPVHAPTFIAFARQNETAKVGSVCLAAYSTQAYKAFKDVVDGLKALCRGNAGSNQASIAQVSSNVRRLTARLTK